MPAPEDGRGGTLNTNEQNHRREGSNRERTPRAVLLHQRVTQTDGSKQQNEKQQQQPRIISASVNDHFKTISKGLCQGLYVLIQHLEE